MNGYSSNISLYKTMLYYEDKLILLLEHCSVCENRLCSFLLKQGERDGIKWNKVSTTKGKILRE